MNALVLFYMQLAASSEEPNWVMTLRQARLLLIPISQKLQNG
ncbi:hypothetical protein ACLKA7_005024, partial [Drosophila subpalustris]